jgi:hypothetical protein
MTLVRVPLARSPFKPLCAGHHQDATGEDKTLIAVHPDKAQFEQRYGPQTGLLALVHAQLNSNNSGEV